jgi:putative acetyltransferase
LPGLAILASHAAAVAEVAVTEPLSFAPESPLAEDLVLLFQRHTAEMHADTPPESIHMLPREALVSPAIEFFVLRQSGKPLGMAALKCLGDGHAEVKSMHVLAEARGRGLSRLMLDRLIDHARQSGLTRLSLETGAQPGFAAARSLYARGGFAECPPFGSYRPDPNSVFMTLAL